MPVKLLAFLLLITLAKNSGYAAQELPRPFSGKVIKIVDGDTYDVLSADYKTIRIRMNGIDAPEKKQAYGQRSKDHLGLLCFGKTVRVVPVKYDRNKRLIADSFTESGLNLSREMVRSGYAWHFTKYSSDKNLRADEEHARSNRLGLWTDNQPIAPWTFRSMRKS